MKHNLLLIAAAAGLSLPAAATDIDFTYNTDNKELMVYGYDKKETYDVAIKIDAPEYIGARVAGFTVILPVNNNGVKDITGWMSTELKLESKKNVADIASVAGTLTDEVLEVKFDQPYTITTSGVFVGYSFTITDLTKTYEYDWPGSPVAVVESNSNLDNGLWMHTSRTRLKWDNIAKTLGAVSPMVVHLQTDFGPYDVAVNVPAENYMVAGETYNVPITIINHGSNPIEDLAYSWQIGDVKNSGSIHLDTPIEALGKTGLVNFPLGPITECGEYNFTFTVDSNNGQPNNDQMRSGSGNMNVWPVIPVNRPLVEEFTGLNCGYCPRGYVAMEEMHNTLGDMFVGMAYHSSSYESAMVTVANSNFPVDIDGFPSADINRKDIMDPSYLPSYWANYAADIVPASVDVDLAWTDDTHTVAKATSRVTFVKDIENADYKLAFALVADGLHNPGWGQSNYYSGESEGDGVDSELWDTFLNGGSKVYGLTFNDVVAYFKEVKGIEGSVPATITRGVELVNEYTFNIDDVKTISGKEFLTDGCTLKAVVILLDGQTGYSVNCNKSENLTFWHAGIGDISSDNAEIVSTRYYNLQGVEVANPTDGVYVKSETLSDGTRRTFKVVVK